MRGQKKGAIDVTQKYRSLELFEQYAQNPQQSKTAHYMTEADPAFLRALGVAIHCNLAAVHPRSGRPIKYNKQGAPMTQGAIVDWKGFLKLAKPGGKPLSRVVSDNTSNSIRALVAPRGVPAAHGGQYLDTKEIIGATEAFGGWTLYGTPQDSVNESLVKTTEAERRLLGITQWQMEMLGVITERLRDLEDLFYDTRDVESKIRESNRRLDADLRRKLQSGQSHQNFE